MMYNVHCSSCLIAGKFVHNLSTSDEYLFIFNILKWFPDPKSHYVPEITTKGLILGSGWGSFQNQYHFGNCTACQMTWTKVPCRHLCRQLKTNIQFNVP